MRQISIKLFLIFIVFIPAWAGAEVSEIKFITPSRTVAPGVISSVLTIQFVDDSDQTQSLGETGDLILETTSATGVFVNSQGNSLSTTVNSNWTSRSFYYQDTSLGEYTITATLTTRNSGKEFSTSQSIIVGEEVVEEEQISNTNSNNNQSENLSSHSSQASVSVVKPKPVLEVFGGRDRLVLVGSVIDFEASLVKEENINTTVEYSWSFGDGKQALGKKVSHQYLLPGVYTVLVKAKTNDIESVFRLKVVVVKPQVDINWTGEAVKITNLGKEEINLIGWSIRQADLIEEILTDVIVLPGNYIHLTLEKIKDPWLVVDGASKIVHDFKTELLAQQVIDLLSEKVSSLTNTVITNYVEPKKVAVEQIVLAPTTTQLLTRTKVIEKDQNNFLKSIFVWPSRGVDILANFLLK